jgi:hypothetical protein
VIFASSGEDFDAAAKSASEQYHREMKDLLKKLRY